RAGLRAHPERVVLVRGPLQASVGPVPAAAARPSLSPDAWTAERVPGHPAAPDSHRAPARLRAGGRAGPALPRRCAAARIAGAAARPDRSLLPPVGRVAVHRAGRAQAVSSILFATEYYPPFAPGGAEWSTAAWAAALAGRGHRVTVVTPNYGAAGRETRDGATVIRVPFPVRLRPGQGSAGWLVHRNPLFHRYFGWQVARAARATGAEIVHAQGKAALVGAARAGAILGRPVLVTIRDLGLICPFGHCTQIESWKTFDCPVWSRYRGQCVPYHLAHYRPGTGAWGRAKVWLAAAVAFRDQKRLQRALRSCRAAIGVSRGVLDLFDPRLLPARTAVVHNLPPRVAEAAPAAAAEARRRLGIHPGPLVLYAGKLSIGKGTDVLLRALDPIRALVPGVRFALAGKGGMAIPAAPDLHRLGEIA